MRTPLIPALVAGLLQAATTIGQVPIQSNFQNVTPPSPEVAAFAKYVDIPMSYTSGTPQIAIPVFTVRSGNIEVPVTLSYNASGIRVSEVATWVGLGWNLSTGPTLTRMTRALSDESPNGVMNAPPNRTIKYLSELPYWPNDGWDERALIELQAKDGILDFEPDIFNFSALGYSGSFYWNQDSARFILVPYQNIRLQYSGGSFIITLPNGIQCFFNCPCETMAWSSTLSVVNGISNAPTSVTASDPSSWTISQIREPSGRSIHFNYSMDYNVYEFGRGSETRGVSLSNESGAHIASYSQQMFHKPVLLSISGENGTVYFNRSSSVREDVYNASRALESIRIVNSSAAEMKTFVFNYGYQVSPETIVLPNLAKYTEVARKRLFLQSVTEKNLATGLSLPPWEFTYDSMPLPNRLSNQQDYWGYYNGKPQQDHLLLPRIPKKFRSPVLISNELPAGYIPGADRTIDTRCAQAGLLTRIKYPTGGTTSYYYESNDAIANMYYRDHDGIERPDINTRSFLFSNVTVPVPVSGAGYLKDTFRVLTPLTKVRFDVTFPLPCNPWYEDPTCEYTLKITGQDDPLISFTRRQTGWVYYYLPRGLYKIELFYSGLALPVFDVRAEWGEVADTINFKIGGLRVYKIVSDDGAGNKISRSFSYRWPGDSTRYSSGVLAGLPCHINYEYSGPGTIQSIVRFHYVSNSAIPLTSDGQTVRYMFVNEFFDSLKTSFKTEYTFLSDFPAIAVGPADNTPPLQKNWLNNVLLRKRHFEKTPSGYRPLTDEWNIYESRKELSWLGGLHGIQLRPYQLESAWPVLKYSSSTSFSYENGQENAISSTTHNSYNDMFLLSGNSTVNSKGEILENKIWYPNDFNDVPGFNLSALRSNYLIGLPVKQETVINGKVRSGNVVKYHGAGLPLEIYNYESPVPEDTTPHNRNIVLPARYRLNTRISYDEDFNVTEVITSKDPPVVYVWSNNTSTYGTKTHRVPVASVQNATVAEVAYSSFESPVRGGWQYPHDGGPDASAPTGTCSFYLTGSQISKPGLNSSRIYIVSYWSNAGAYLVPGTTRFRQGRSYGNWRHFEHEVTGVSTISITGSGHIDELRLHPKSALMTSFTYKQGIGVSSQCDPNNRISYFEYDGLGRLKLVKDQDKNILKLADYQYQSLPTQ